MVFGFKKKKQESSDFILGDKEIRKFKSTKRGYSKDAKRKAKLEAMKRKTAELREKNKVLNELEDARKKRANIRKKQFARRTAIVRSAANNAGRIIKKVKKRADGYKSKSPFAPENWK